MSGYGKVISGGDKMSKGVTKNINDKLTGFAKDNERRKALAESVKRALDKNNLSAPDTNNFNGKTFVTPSKPAKV